MIAIVRLEFSRIHTCGGGLFISFIPQRFRFYHTFFYVCDTFANDRIANRLTQLQCSLFIMLFLIFLNTLIHLHSKNKTLNFISTTITQFYSTVEIISTQMSLKVKINNGNKNNSFYMHNQWFEHLEGRTLRNFVSLS